METLVQADMFEDRVNGCYGKDPDDPDGIKDYDLDAPYMLMAPEAGCSWRRVSARAVGLVGVLLTLLLLSMQVRIQLGREG